MSCWLVGIKLYNFKIYNGWILLLFYVHNAHNNVFHVLFKIAFLWIVLWEEWRKKLVLFCIILASINKDILKRIIELSIKICWVLEFASIPICPTSGNLHVAPLILTQIV